MATLDANALKLRQIERNRQLAAALQQQAMSFEPIRHPYQGLAKLAQAWVAAKMNNRADERTEAAKQAEIDAITKALGPKYGTIMPNVPAPGGNSIDTINQMANAPTPLPADPQPQIQTSPGLPQRQIDQIMALPSDVRSQVLGNYVQNQLIPPKQEIRSAEVFGEINDQTGQITNRFSVIPGTPEYEIAVNDERYVRVGLPSGIQRQETGGPGSMTNTQQGAEQKEIALQASALNTFARGTEKLLGIIQDNPGANTLVAQMTNVGNQVVQNVRALGTAMKVEYEVGEKTAWDVNHYEDIFKANGLAGANPRVKSGFLAMAIQKAMASGLGTGRALSDYDIKNQLNTLGANQSDPDIIASVFSDAYDYLDIYTRSRYQAMKDVGANVQLPDIYQPSYLNIIPLEQMPGWDTATPEEKARARELFPNGYRSR